MSYDYAGFETAKNDSVSTNPELTTKEEFFEAFEYTIKWGSHDWSLGHCESFQIYNQDGEIIFNSENKDSSTKGEVA
jgi:hypothetical protein